MIHELIVNIRSQNLTRSRLISNQNQVQKQKLGRGGGGGRWDTPSFLNVYTQQIYSCIEDKDQNTFSQV